MNQGLKNLLLLSIMGVLPVSLFAAQKKPSKSNLESLMMTGFVKPQPKTAKPKPTKKEKRNKQKVDAPMASEAVEKPHAQAQPQPVQMPAAQDVAMPAIADENTQFRKMVEIIDPEMYEKLKKTAHARKDFFGTQVQELNKLLAQGYSACARNGNGMAIISDALVAQNFELVQLLCQAGAQLDVFQPVINKTPYQIAYDMKDENDQTAKIWHCIENTYRRVQEQKTNYNPLFHVVSHQGAVAPARADNGKVEVAHQKEQADQKARMQPHENRFKRANTIIKILGTQSSPALEKELKDLYFDAVNDADLKTVLEVRKTPGSKKYAVNDVTGGTVLTYLTNDPGYIRYLLVAAPDIVRDDILVQDKHNKNILDYITEFYKNDPNWRDVYVELEKIYQQQEKLLQQSSLPPAAPAGVGEKTNVVEALAAQKKAQRKIEGNSGDYRLARAYEIIESLKTTQNSQALEKELKELYFKAVKVGDLKTILAIRQVPDSKRFAVEDATAKTALIYFAQSDNPQNLTDLIAQDNNIIYEDILLKDKENKSVLDYLDAKINMPQWKDIIGLLNDAYQHMACIEDESNHDDDKQDADASEALKMAVSAAAGAGQGAIDKEPAALASSWTQEFAAKQVEKPMPKINPVTESDLQKWEKKQAKAKKQQNDSKSLTSAQRRKARRDEIEHKNERKKAQEKLQREQQRKAEQERVNALKAQQEQAQKEAARIQQEQAQEQERQHKIEAHKKAEQERAEKDLQDRLAQRAQEKEAQRLKEQHEREQQEKIRKAAELAHQQEQVQKELALKAQLQAEKKAKEDAERRRAAQEQDERESEKIRWKREELLLQKQVGRIKPKESQQAMAMQQDKPHSVNAAGIDHEATHAVKKLLQQSMQAQQQQAHEKLFKAVAFGDLEGIRNSGVQNFNIKDINNWDPIRALMYEFKNSVHSKPLYTRYKESLRFLLQQNISLKDLGDKERNQLVNDARTAFRVDENTDLLGLLADYCKKQENYLLYSELKDVKHEIETSRQKGVNNLWSAYAQKLQESELGSYYWAHYFKSLCQHYAAGLIPVPANTALTARIAPQAPAVLLPQVQQNAQPLSGAGYVGNGVKK